LNLLQANPNAPPDYLQAAEPIAMAMGALHRIEKEGAAALKPSATEALDAVRAALSILQSKAAADPYMMQTMEAVASSLGTIFGLTKSAELVSVVAPQPVQQAPYQPPVQQAPYQPPVQQAPYQPPVQQAPYQPPVQQAPYQPPVQQPYQPPVQQAPYQPPPAPQAPYQPPAQAYQPPVQQAPYQPPPQVQPQQPYAPPQPPVAQPMQPQPAYGPAPVPAYAPPPQPQAGFKPPGVVSPAAPNPAPAGGWSESDPFAAPKAAAPAAAAVGAAPAALSASPDAYRGADVPIIEAELGTHSVTNFYRGLSGSDVVDHGGLFVATYNVPHVGQTLKVQVSLPGGYEFEAIGVVRWTRESRESMTSDVSPPGCGIQFTHIAPEARQLVYRYVRNREPLFHDDL
jgi:hypothetical protein